MEILLVVSPKCRALLSSCPLTLQSEIINDPGFHLCPVYSASFLRDNLTNWLYRGVEMLRQVQVVQATPVLRYRSGSRNTGEAATVPLSKYCWLFLSTSSKTYL